MIYYVNATFTSEYNIFFYSYIETSYIQISCSAKGGKRLKSDQPMYTTIERA